jgi:hypothetical protein
MDDQLVSFETAKLAKERGFISKSPYYQIDDADKIDLVDMKGFPLHSNNEDGDYYEAPTQSLLQKWLREIHNNVVLIARWTDGHHNLFYHAIVNGNTVVNDGFTTYEEALEVGLYETLKLIN